MQLRAPGALHAMDRPDATVLLEMGRRFRVPVLRVEDPCAGHFGGVDLRVDKRHYLFAALDVKVALRIGEVVLDVDDEQGGSRVVRRHAAQ
jgi:hypothetical protein